MAGIEAQAKCRKLKNIFFYSQLFLREKPCYIIGTRTAVRVTNIFENAQWKSRFFRDWYLGFSEYRNNGSSVLYSPWASDHLYTHRNNWITVSILQYRVTFWTPEIVQRLDQLSKSVGSFGIRCGLGWVLGGSAGTISSWAVPEKTTKKTPEKCDFWLSKLPIIGLATSILSVHGRSLKFLMIHSQDPKLKALFYSSKSWFVAEI